MNPRKIGISFSYLNIVLQAVIGFVYVPLLLHYIGKSEYGLYQLMGSFIAYLGLMDFGLTTAVVRFYTKYRTERKELMQENLLALAMRGYGVVSLLMLLTGAVLYFYLPRFFAGSMTVTEITSAQQIFLVLLFNIILNMLTLVFRAILNSHQKYLFLKGTETLQLLLQPIIVILVLQQHPSALALALVQTALNILLACLRIYYCFNKLQVKIKFHCWDAAMVADFRKLALSVFAVSIIDHIFFKTNKVILGIVDGTSAVAVYSLASIVYMNYMALSVAISSVYLPYVTEMVTKDEPIENFTKLFIKIGRVQYFLLALVSSGFIVFGKQFVVLWAGSSFAAAYWMTLLIIIPFTIDLIQNIGLVILNAQNRLIFRSKVYLCMGIFNLGLAVPLALQYGGVGCAFATGLSMLIGNGFAMNWYYARVIGLDIKRFWREIGRITWGVMLLTAGGLLLRRFIISDSKVLFGMEIVIYTMCYGAVMYRWFSNAEEKAKVNALVLKVVSHF